MGLTDDCPPAQPGLTIWPPMTVFCGHHPASPSCCSTATNWRGSSSRLSRTPQRFPRWPGRTWATTGTWPPWSLAQPLLLGLRTLLPTLYKGLDFEPRTPGTPQLLAGTRGPGLPCQVTQRTPNSPLLTCDALMHMGQWAMVAEEVSQAPGDPTPSLRLRGQEENGLIGGQMVSPD